MSILMKLIVSLLLGAAIGLERESYERKVDKTKTSGKGSLGVRSYILITTLGTVASSISAEYFSLYLLISVTFAVLLVAYYVIGSFVIKDHGLTTDLAILWSYVIGALIGFEALPMHLIVALTVVMILILSAKAKIKSFVAGLKDYEFEDFLAFAIIALVILPFLPDRGYSANDIPFLNSLLNAFNLDNSKLADVSLVNPFGVWKVVAIITGVEIVGYFLEKAVGQKSGWLLASIAGGFVSSTSTTISLAVKSTKTKDNNRLVAAALLANLSSFVQILILIASVNTLFLISNIAFIASLSIATLILVIYFLSQRVSPGKSVKNDETSRKRDIFSLRPALQFAALYMVVKMVTQISLVLFGNSGFIVSNIMAALSGLDAITLNVSELAGKSISVATGVLTLILANAVNLLSKSFYSHTQGSRQFALKFFVSVLIMIAASFIGYFFVS
jgi:uncharacterized membrane protein (DUF4010 family)